MGTHPVSAEQLDRAQKKPLAMEGQRRWRIFIDYKEGGHEVGQRGCYCRELKLPPRLLQLYKIQS